jgi:adenylate cyclase class IV
MAKFEIEQRGRLSKEKFLELDKIFRKDGEFVDVKKRLSLIWCTSVNSAAEVKDEKIDLRLRVTNGEGEVVLKHGKWSGSDSRKEFSFPVKDADNFWDYLEFVRILGYHKFLVTDTIKNDYHYKGIEFSLVEIPKWGYYFEAEILVDEDGIDAANKKIEEIVHSVGLELIDETGYHELLDSINARPGSRIDLDTVDMDDLKSKFEVYFNNKG